MTTSSTPLAVRHAITKIKRTYSEIGYAQRRLTEIRTGLELSAPRQPRQSASVKRLEELYAPEQPRRAA